MPDNSFKFKYADEPKENKVINTSTPFLPETGSPSISLKYAYDPSYDKNLRPEYNQEWHRADNQAWYEQVYKGFLSRGLSVGTKIGQSIGALTGIVPAIADGNIGKIWDNPVFNLFQEADDSLREAFPVYQSKEYQQGDLLGKMGTSTFWTTDFFDAVAYAASAYAPGKLLGGVSKLLSGVPKAVNSTEFGASLLKSLNKYGITAHNTNMALATAWNTVAEAGVEAYQTQKDLELIYQADLGLSPEEAKKKAADNAAQTFWWNAGVLLVPNYIQNKFFHGMDANERAKLVREQVWKNKGVADKISYAKSIWKNVAEGVVSEGLWEENIQSAIQNYEKQLAYNDTDKNAVYGIASNMVTNLKGFAKSFIPGMTTTPEDTEAAASILLGGILGGFSGAFGGFTEAAKMEKLSKDKESRYKNLFEVDGKTAVNTFVENASSLFKNKGTKKITVQDQEVEVPDYEIFTDADGNVRLKHDEQAVLRKTINELYNSKLFDAGVVAAYDADHLMDSYNNSRAASMFAFQLATNPKKYSAEEINDYLDSLVEIGTEEAKAVGVNTYIKDNVDQIKQNVKLLQDIDNKWSKVTEDPSSIGFNNFAKKLDYHLSTKVAALQELRKLATKDKTKEAIDVLLKDATEAISTLTNERANVEKEYVTRIQNPFNLLKQLNELNKKSVKTKEDEDQIKHLSYLYKEHTSINGDWLIQDNPYGNIGVVTSPKIQAKVTPGTRDNVAYLIGKQQLAYADVEAGLNNNEDPVELASKYISNTSLVDEIATDLQTKLLGKLNAEEVALTDSLNKTIQDNDLTDLKYELQDRIIENATDPTVPLPTLQDLNTTVPEWVTNKFKAAGIESTTPIDVKTFQNIFTPLEEESSLIIAEQQQLVRGRTNLINLSREGVANINSSNNVSKLKFYESAIRNNRLEEHLKDEFFMDNVFNVGSSLIDEFESNPEQFANWQKYSDVMSLLNYAKAAYTLRTDISEGTKQNILSLINSQLNFLESKIYPQLLALTEKLAIKQIQSNNDTTLSMAATLGLAEHRLIKDVHQEINKLLEEILGKEVVKKLADLFDVDNVLLSIDGMYLVLDQIKTKASKDQIDRYIGLLDKAGMLLMAKAKVINDKELPDQYFESKTDQEPLYLAAPDLSIMNLVISLFYDKQANDPNSVIYKYKLDLDFFALLEALPTAKDLTDQEKDTIREIYQIHNLVSNNRRVKSILLDFNNTFSSYINEKEKLFTTIKPSLQQNIVLSDLFRFIYTKITGTSFYNNWFVLKGVGGSGKTFLVSHILGKLSKNKIYAFAPSVETSANVNDAIFGGNAPKTTLNSFLSITNSELDNIDIIVLDEVFAFNNEQLFTIHKILEQYRKDSGRVIKVVAMGDPSQVVAKQDNLSDLITERSRNSFQTIPLTSNFRTNIGAINSLMVNYRLTNRDVVDIPIQSNKSLEEISADTSTAFGALSANQDAIIDLINSSTSSRSRVLIVPNQEQVRALSSKVNIPVRTPGQVQGFQWEEVYLIGDKREFDETNIEINRALYTSISRAKSFIVVDSRLKAINSISSAVDMSTKAQEQLDQVLELYNELTTQTEEVNKVLNNLPDVSINDVTNPIEVDNDFPKESEDIARDSAFSSNAYAPDMESITLKSIPKTEEGGEDYSISFPTNYNLNPDDIVLNQKVHFVRFTGNDNKSLIGILAEKQNNNTKFLFLGAVGTKDLDKPFFTDLLIAKPDSFIDKVYLDKGQTGIEIIDINKVSLGTATLSDYSPLKSTYNLNEFYEGDDVIENAIIKFYNSFFGVTESGHIIRTKEYSERGPDADWVVDGRVNWDALKGKISIGIFGHKSTNSLPIELAKGRVGVPYLIIKNPAQANAKDEVSAKTMYIRLEPKRFSKNSKYYLPLFKFYRLIQALEDSSPYKLGTFELYDAIHKYALDNFESLGEQVDGLNYSIKKKESSRPINEYFQGMSNPEEFTQIVDELVRLSYGVRNRIKYFTSEEECKSLVGTEYNGHKITDYKNLREDGQFLGQLYFKADPTTEIENIYREDVVTYSEGPAQTAYNAIARANEKVGNTRIRIEQRDSSRPEIKFSRAKSLFGTFEKDGSPAKDAIDWSAFYDDLAIQGVDLDESNFQHKGGAQHLINHLIKHYAGKVLVTAAGPITITDEGSVRDIIDNYKTNMVNSGNLAAIVDPVMFDESGSYTTQFKDQGFLLREPLHMSTINTLGNHGKAASNKGMTEEARKSLNSMLSHSFVGMNKTRVVLNISGEQQVEKPKYETVGQILDELSKKNFAGYISNLITLFSTSSKIKNIKFKIAESKENKVELLEDGTPVVTYSSKVIDNILDNPQAASIFLHELTHVATMTSLYRVKYKIDPTEEDIKLYKALSGIQLRFNAYINFKLKKQNPGFLWRILGNEGSPTEEQVKSITSKDFYTSSPSKKNVVEFIANLSNEKFYSLASSISIGDKFITVLQEILDAILDFLGINSKTSYYDATYKLLEQYLRNFDSTTPITVVAESGIEDRVNTYIKDLKTKFSFLKDQLASAEEEGNTDLEESIQAKIDILLNNPVYDLINNDFKSAWKLADLSEKKSKLDIIATNFAYYVAKPTEVISSPGLILSTLPIQNFVQEKFGDLLSSEGKILVRSIIQKQMLDPKSNVLRDFIAFAPLVNKEEVSVDSKAKFIDYIYWDILEDYDRTKLKQNNLISSDVEMILQLNILFEKDDLVNEFIKASYILSVNKDKVSGLITNTVDSNLRRYKFARQYLSNKIYDNANNNFEIIKTKNEILKEVIEDLKKIDSPEIIRLTSEQKSLKQEISDLGYGVLTPINAMRSIELNAKLSEVEDQLFALKSLTTNNKRTGRLLFYDILEDIYPKSQWNDAKDIDILTEDLEYIINDRGDRELRESANINEYMKDYSKSKELTLSESLKDFLAFVPDPNRPNRFLNPGLVYIKTLQTFLDMDTILDRSSKKGLSYLLEQLKQKLKSKGLSNTDKVVLNNLVNLITRATSKQVSAGESTLLPNISIVTKIGPLGKVLYAGIVSKGDIDISSYTYEQALQNNSVEISPATESSSSLYNWLANKYQQLGLPFDFKVYNALFKKAESINALRELYNNMGSMKEVELYNATRSNKKGSRFIYQHSVSSGITYGVKEDMKMTIREMHNTRDRVQTQKDMLSTLKSRYKSIYSTLNPSNTLWNNLSSGTADLKLEAINYFFKLLLPKGYIEDIQIPTRQIVSIANDIIYFLDRTENIKIDLDSEIKDADIASAENSSNTKVSKGNKEYSTIDRFFDSEVNGALTRWSNLIKKSLDLTRNSSVRDGNGNKFYKIHESTFGDDVLDTLINVADNKPFFTKFEFLNTNLYSKNAFINGKNTIHELGMHGVAVNTDNGAVTPLMRENKFWFYHREFIQGFLSGADSSSGNTYYAFTYPPSDKPKHPFVRVNILSNAEIKEQIKDILEALIEKPNVPSSKLFTNFKIAETALNELSATKDNVDIDSWVNKIYELMEKESSKLVRELINPELGLSFDRENTYKIFNSLKEKIGHNVKYEDQPFYTNVTKDNNKQYVVKVDEVSPVFDLFFKNHYINSYFINQLIAGDYHAYKDTEDLVKRMAGILGPGIKPLVDPVIGTSQHFKVLVLDDTVVSAEEQRTRLKQLIFGEKEELSAEESAEFEELMKFFEDYKITDGQGFMTPKRYAELSKGFGRSWGMGNIMKPMYFGVHSQKVTDNYTTSTPIYLKYSSVNLEDSLVNRFKLLKDLRDRMEHLGIDELVFKSVTKVGIPQAVDSEGNSVKMTFNDFVSAKLEDLEAINGYKTSPILTLNNAFYRLQLNPASDPNKLVPIFSQLMYFLNINENDINEVDAARKAYETVAELVSMGREEILDTVSNKSKLYNFLRKRFDGPGAERALDLLTAGLSLNHPLLEKKAIVALSSGMESTTVKVKFNGGKLVLQTAEGIRLNNGNLTDKEYKLGDELQYRKTTIAGKEVFYAEVIVPETLLTEEQRLAIGNQDLFMYGDGIGYRIPSTELHSAIPLKIVGTYSDVNTNVIIAPKDLVSIHGSDFDVDALFIILREKYNKSNITSTSADAITELLNSYKFYQEQINEAYKELSPEDRLQVISIIDKINKQNRLLLDSNNLEEPSEEFNLKTEKKFQNYITKPRSFSWAENEIVLKNQPNFNESKSRVEFGKKYGVIYKNKNWIPLNDSARQALENFRDSILLASKENPELFKKAKGLINLISKVKTDLPIDDKIWGTEDSFVGYIKQSNGLYEFNPSFLEEINEELNSLNGVLDSLPVDFKYLFENKVKREIKTLKDIKSKFLKNVITESMLQTIADPDNIYRMVTPISFSPIINAISNVENTNKKLIPSSHPDLSNISDKQKTYDSLSAGQILTGAFANAVKVYAYLLRAGSDSETIEYLNNYFKTIKELDNQKKKYAGNNSEEVLKVIKDLEASLNTQKESLSTKIKERKEKSSLVSADYWFSISLNGKQELFNDIALKDRLGNFKTTQVFDTLINAAIDNLKLNYLGKARINTLTGSAAIGLTTLGVPLDITTLIFYQPMFDPLFDGTINNLESWIQSIEEKYKAELESLEVVPVSDLQLKDGLTKRTIDTSLPTFNTQLKAFVIFRNAYRIGESIRDLADFMNVIRELPVFIEDIDEVFSKFDSKIGILHEIENEVPIIQNRKSFAFATPFLFKANPHIYEAYKTLESLRDIISDNFVVHSKEIRGFIEDAYKQIDLEDTSDLDNKNVNLAYMRRNLVYYFLVSGVWDRIDKVPNKKYSLDLGFSKPTNITLSKAKSFNEEVIDKFDKVRKFSFANNIENQFLRYSSISTNEFGIKRISFKGGVNLNPVDIEEITQGFKELNKFDFDSKGNVILIDRVVDDTSNLQKDLITYAILNFGLQFSSSNYSNYLPATALEESTENLDKQLSQFKNNLSQEELESIKRHFLISYALQNAERLPFVTKEESIPTTTKVGSDERKYNLYNGKKTIESGDFVDTIWYDRAVKVTGKPHEFIRVGYNNRVTVYKKVAVHDKVAYYQIVGKNTEVAFSNLPEEFKDKYLQTDFFNPSEFTLQFHDSSIDPTEIKSGDVLELKSFTEPIYLDNGEVKQSLVEGDEFWAVPSFNADRLQRIRVKLKYVDIQTKKDASLVSYTVEVVNTKLSPEEKIIKDLDKQCKHGL